MSGFCPKPTFTYKCKVVTPWPNDNPICTQAEYGPSTFRFDVVASPSAAHVRPQLSLIWPKGYDKVLVKCKLGVVNKNGNMVLTSSQEFSYDDRKLCMYYVNEAVERSKLTPHRDELGFVTFGVFIQSVTYTPNDNVLLADMWDKISNEGKMASTLQKQLDQARENDLKQQEAMQVLQAKHDSLLKTVQDLKDEKIAMEKSAMGLKRKHDCIDVSKDEEDSSVKEPKQQKLDILTRLVDLTKESISAVTVADLRKMHLAISAYNMKITDAMVEGTMCNVCLTEEAVMLMQPCGHRRTCEKCCMKITSTTNTCPMCRTGITGVQKVFV